MTASAPELFRRADQARFGNDFAKAIELFDAAMAIRGTVGLSDEAAEGFAAFRAHCVEKAAAKAAMMARIAELDV